MATEEEGSRPHSLPTYPEMILAAVSALSESDGATTKSSIAEYIESAHGDELPQTHSSLLAAHLARMEEIGELVVVNGGYFRVGSDAPLPKRGRGRPPKSRLPGSGASAATAVVPSGDGAAAGAAAAPRRPRGRPPKAIDPLAPVKVPRPRGRPPKNPQAGEDGTGGPAIKRPRGRPPKVPPQFAEVGFV